MNKFKDELHRRCECGHERIVHGPDYERPKLSNPCHIKGCGCHGYTQAERVVTPRIAKAKTLDKADPKLFEVA